MSKSALAVLLAVFLAASGPSAYAQSANDKDSGDNLSFTLTIGRTGGKTPAGEKVHKFVGQAGRSARILMGWRLPIPTRASDAPSGEPAATSYIYQNIGVTAELETRSLGGKRFLVSGKIEISAVHPSAAAAPPGSPPMIGTFNQELQLALLSGKKVRVAQGPDPEGGDLFLDLQVDVLE